jgi:hypothetical protein
MKLAIGLLALSSAQAAWHPSLTAMRRIAQIGNCAVQAADAASTVRAVGLGARETNGLYTRSDGSLSTSRLLLFKAALCALPIASSEWAHRKASNRQQEAIFIGLAGVSIGITSRALVGNYDAINRLSPHVEGISK